MRKAFIALGVGCALLLFQRPVCGQSQPPEGKGALPNSAFDDDPIGIDPNAPPPDQTTAPAPSPASKARKIDLSFGPSPRRGRAVAGEVLTAMPSVRETRHEVNATLGSGFAQILVHLHLENSVDEPAEILYRLAVPDGAVVTSLRVCRGELCRDGLPQANPQSPSAYDAALLARGPETQGNAEVAPIADVRLAEDERGSFLRLRAAPVRKSEELDLWLGYLVEARVVGGLVRLGLPARGMDPRVAAAKIEFNSGTLTRPQVDDIALEPGQTVERPPWMGLELNAKMASDAGQGVQVATFPCGQMQCNRVRAWAAPAAARPLDIVLAIDGSPSMAGPARNRLSKAVAAVLEAAPVGSTVRAVLFASRAQALIGKRRPLEAVTMAEFGDLLTGHDLGSATRLESVLETVKGWKTGSGARSPQQRLLVVLGDGGMTTGEQDAFVDAKRHHWPIAVVNLSDVPARRGMVQSLRHDGGLLIEAGVAARAMERSGKDDALRERMTTLFAPQRSARVTCSGRKLESADLGPLHAGDEIVQTLTQPAGASAIVCKAPGVGSVLARRVPLGGREDPLLAAWAQAQGEEGRMRILSAVAAEDLAADNGDFPEAPHFQPLKKGEEKRCDHRGPTRRKGGINRDDAPIILAYPRVCLPRPKVAEGNLELGRGMPSDPLLQMLRDRIIPVARDCFRRDRAGRADYAVRAVFRFELAEQEVVDARVEGEIDPRLRTCLIAAVDTLLVPRFTGVVRVSYPLRTLREALPVRLELSDVAAREVDQLIKP